MRSWIPRLPALVAVGLWSTISAGGPAWAQGAAEPPAAAEPPTAAPKESTTTVPLAPVEVRGKRNLFDEQAAKRKKLLDESAPCLGCDAKPVVHRRKLLERIADYALDQVTPQAAPEPDAAGSVEHQVLTESRHPGNATP